MKKMKRMIVKPIAAFLPSRRNTAGLLLLILLSLNFPLSFAHVQKTAVTRVLFNPATSNIEVMHRFLIHDAEHAAQQLFGAGQDLLGSADSRTLFSSYVINRFSIEAQLSNGASVPLELEYLGTEIDGQFIWVYQETKIIEGIESFSMVNMALRDVWPDQSNLVNVERQGKIFSALFDSGAEVKNLKI
jgi:hypothetical protein